MQVPLGVGLRRGGWTNVALNVAQLVPALFGGALLRSIDTITLGARARAAATPDESHGVECPDAAPWRGSHFAPA